MFLFVNAIWATCFLTDTLALLAIKVKGFFLEIFWGYGIIIIYRLVYWTLWEESFAVKISTKGRYALRLMLDIALESGGEPVCLKEVSRRQAISEKYLEQIVTQLSRAALLRSVRGAGGGYLLTRRAEEYTVGEILRALEGSLAPVSCAEDPACCCRAEQCVAQEVWEQIQAAVNGVVDHITLADLIKRYHEKCEKTE